MSNKKAIGYAYDSMGQQSSLDKQKKAIEEYCSAEGIELQSVHEYSLIPGKDKTDIFKDFLENQNLEDMTVVVSQIDRLAGDFEKFEEIVEMLRTKKATVVSTQEGERKFINNILEKRGVVPMRHLEVPYGYKMEDGELVQEQSEALVVAWIFEKSHEYSSNPPEILTEYVREQLEDTYDSKEVTDEFVLEKSKLRVTEYLAAELNTRLGTYREIGCAMEPETVKEMLESPLTEDDIKIIKAKLRNELKPERKPLRPVYYGRVGNKER